MKHTPHVQPVIVKLLHEQRTDIHVLGQKLQSTKRIH